MSTNEKQVKTFDEQIRENREALKSLLVGEKVRLIRKLGEKFGLDDVRDYGACGRIELGEKFGLDDVSDYGACGSFKLGSRSVDVEVNCCISGKPCATTGHATSPLLSSYYWIPIVCHYDGPELDDLAKHAYNYMVALTQQDIDFKTGNFHTVFGAVQIWRGLEEFEGCEIGGEINEAPCLKCFNKYHRVQFNAQKAFPPAVRNIEIYDGDILNPGEKPWGIQWDAGAWGTIPKTFDMGSSDYRTEDIARFATNLIIADFTANLKKQIDALPVV